MVAADDGISPLTVRSAPLLLELKVSCTWYMGMAPRKIYILSWFSYYFSSKFSHVTQLNQFRFKGRHLGARHSWKKWMNQLKLILAIKVYNDWGQRRNPSTWFVVRLYYVDRHPKGLYSCYQSLVFRKISQYSFFVNTKINCFYQLFDNAIKYLHKGILQWLFHSFLFFNPGRTRYFFKVTL